MYVLKHEQLAENTTSLECWMPNCSVVSIANEFMIHIQNNPRPPTPIQTHALTSDEPSLLKETSAATDAETSDARVPLLHSAAPQTSYFTKCKALGHCTNDLLFLNSPIIQNLFFNTFAVNSSLNDAGASQYVGIRAVNNHNF